MKTNKNTKKEELGFQEFMFELKAIYGEVPQCDIDRAKRMYLEGGVTISLLKAIHVILLKYNTFDLNQVLEEFSDIPYRNQGSALYIPSERIPYPLGAMVPSNPSELLGRWDKVRSAIDRVIIETMKEGWVSKGVANDAALNNERLIYQFIQAVSHMPQSLPDAIWQEIRDPGSVVEGMTLPAHQLLKVWVIMEFDREVQVEDACPDPELLQALQFRIQAESRMGYLDVDEAFMSYMWESYPVNCQRSESTVWSLRMNELWVLQCQLEDQDEDEDTSDVA
jgi:hypothetical protein